jgi:hypothetical protein
MALDLVAMVGGLLLLCVVLFDIMATVLHPQIESLLSARFQQLIWYLLKRVQRLLGPCDSGCTVLNWGLPIMVAGLIALWLLLLTLSFALMYYPWLDDPTLFNASNPIDGSLLDAIYYSGVTLATLGYGDIQPLHPLLRLLAVTEAALGAVTVAFAVAYVLAVYPAIAQLQIIAVALDAEVAGQADAVPMVRRYLSSDGHWHEALTTRLRELGLQLLQLTESHETHPVLYYAHPRVVQHSFLRVLINAQSLVGALRYGLAPDKHPDIVNNPQLLLLEQSLHYSLSKLANSLHIPPLEELHNPPDQEHYAREFATICAALEHIGLTSSRGTIGAAVPVLVGADVEAQQADEPQPHSANGREVQARAPSATKATDPALDLKTASALEAYVAFRCETDPRITGYAAAAGYTLEAAYADYTTTWWVGR